MASVLYPPIIDSYVPAFNNKKCVVYFSFSKFNLFSKTDLEKLCLHVSVTKQDNGMNMVNTKKNSLGRNRSTGIILDMDFHSVSGKDNLYSFTIEDEDILLGWTAGWIYKIQIRLSQIRYADSASMIGAENWINRPENAAKFSEWSTICTTKAIGAIEVKIPSLDYDSSIKDNTISEGKIKTIYTSTLNLFGEISSTDTSEVLYKYNFKLYDVDNKLLEDSGELFSNQYQNCNEFKYILKTELENENQYTLNFTYVTNNYFTKTIAIKFDISLIETDRIRCTVITIDNDTENLFAGKTSIPKEEEEGRIALKLYSSNLNPYSGNVCIRRSSSKDNFKTWTDIKIYVIREKIINNIEMLYDDTIESGIWYKYGVQSIDSEGNRGILNAGSPVMRNFEYSFLLGENHQQLKLSFNNTMPNYKIQLMESRTETIGGAYPIVTRNSALKYKTFPINGLISFWSDENNLFCNKKIVYGNMDIVELYENYNSRNNIVQYDYIYERDFRKLVLDFLHDGKPKLFKSPTEGNIIIRLTDINCVPNQSLGRMLYEFTSTAVELAENSIDNYIRYGFINPGQWEPDIYTYETKLGQIQMEFTPSTNVFNEIYKKYDSQGKNLGGYKKTLKYIHHVKIIIEDKPLRVKNNSVNDGDIVVGNNIELDGERITIYDPRGIYEFDGRQIFTPNNKLYLLSCAEYEDATNEEEKERKFIPVNATIDFLYELQSEVYRDRKIATREASYSMGQLFDEYQPNTNLSSLIYNKYFIKWNTIGREVNAVTSIEIEANPGTVFKIQDESESILSIEEHEVGDTGVLRFYEMSNLTKIVYMGVRNKVTGEIDQSIPANILLNYLITLIKYTYKGVV